MQRVRLLYFRLWLHTLNGPEHDVVHLAMSMTKLERFGGIEASGSANLLHVGTHSRWLASLWSIVPYCAANGDTNVPHKSAGSYMLVNMHVSDTLL